jgi:uncharacterized protein with NAD-binding domain and iron-sulfur cluster
MAFSQFVNAANMSAGYSDLLVSMFTNVLVAAKPDKANTRTIGMMVEAMVFSALGLGPYKASDRVLNGPTNDVFINPWISHLTSAGVNLNMGYKLTGLDVSGGSITGATLTSTSGATSTVTADYYVLAVPAEQVTPLLTPALAAAAPSLAPVPNLTTDWMNGIQLYLTETINLANGHAGFAGQPWALTSINQQLFWKSQFSSYGDGTVKDCLSIDLSTWDAKGILYGKTAKECTPQEIYNELLAQIRSSLGLVYGIQLPDSIIHSYFIDPDITNVGTPQVANAEPLLINTVGSWAQRPTATTKIPNLFLASDYVQNHINLATMEGANEAGRAAANGILAASGSNATPATLFALYQPPELGPFYALDDTLYALGRPNEFDTMDPYTP